MNTTSPGQIYLADQRGLTENNVFRRFSTFNYEDYYNEHRKSVGKLDVFNDEMLAAGKSITYSVENNSYLLILPITGELVYKQSDLKQQLDVGEVYISHLSAGSTFKIENSYEVDWINFLYVQISSDQTADYQFAKTYSFDFDTAQNQLINLIQQEDNLVDQLLPFSVYLGRFDGRSDTILKLNFSDSILFSFVIAGAFEMQGRLMHERDGLTLWQLKEADLEALSNNAIMLLIETN